MKKRPLIVIAALVLSLMLIGVLAIEHLWREAIVDDKPPPRYRVTFAESLDTVEAKAFLWKYNVSLLHITYAAPGFSGTGLVTDIDDIEEIAENIIRAWESDVSDQSLSEEERSKAKRFLNWSKDNSLKVSAFEGIGSPEEALRADVRVKRVEEF